MNEYKKIITNIINKEAKDNNVNINLTITTIKEYIKEKRKNGKLYQLLSIYGYEENSNIYIFLDTIINNNDTSSALFKVLSVSYHEARHVIQEHLSLNSYEVFFKDIAEYIKNQTFLDPNSSFVEIDANAYGNLKAKEYLINNNYQEYLNNKKEIELIISNSINNYNSLNLKEEIEHLIKILKRKSIIKKLGFSQTININNISNILDIFLDENINIKSIKKILRDERINKIDERIIYSFLSNKYFLKTLDLNTLTEQELAILNKSLLFSKEIYLKQYEALENKIVYDNKEIIDVSKKQNTILYKISALDSILNKINYKKKILKRTNIK